MTEKIHHLTLTRRELEMIAFAMGCACKAVENLDCRPAEKEAAEQFAASMGCYVPGIGELIELTTRIRSTPESTKQ